MGVIPFPHSFDTYIKLIEQEKEPWQGFSAPIRDMMMRILLEETLDDQQADLIANLQKEARDIKQQNAK